MSNPTLTPAQRRLVLAWVEASTRAQGLTVAVTDPATLRRVADLLKKPRSG